MGAAQLIRFGSLDSHPHKLLLDKVMASNSNFSVHATQIAGMINIPNTHQMEAPVDDTLNDFTDPMCRDGTTTGRVVVFGLPLDQSSFIRGKKAEKMMASNTNLSVHETEMAGMINQPNTHQMEAPAEDTLNDFAAPVCRDDRTTGRDVVFGLPLDQSYFSRGKKASGQRVEGSRSTSKGKRKALCATVPVDYGNLLFQKNELLWRVAESLEAFGLMPQKPHFQPLESCSEIQREGEALSLMVLFDKITMKTLNLQFDAPREDLENDLSLLEKLETHGFDVMKLRDILTMILLLKDQQEDVENSSNESEGGSLDLIL